MSCESKFVKFFFNCCNSFTKIFLIYVSSVLVSASLFTAVENVSFIDGLWWSLVTALTIGYGDIAPVTITGKIIGVIFSHFWIFGIVPMIIANIITKIITDENEFTQDEQDFIKDNTASNNKKLRAIEQQLIYIQSMLEIQNGNTNERTEGHTKSNTK